MNRSDLIARLVNDDLKVSTKDAEICVKLILEAMAKSLSHGHRIEIRGFGSFGLNRRGPRTGRNPKSGEPVQVPAKYVPHFKAGRELRQRVTGNKEVGATIAQQHQHTPVKKVADAKPVGALAQVPERPARLL